MAALCPYTVSRGYKYPRIFLTRKRRQRQLKDKYYGPYVDVYLLRQTLFNIKKFKPNKIPGFGKEVGFKSLLDRKRCDPERLRASSSDRKEESLCAVSIIYDEYLI